MMGQCKRLETHLKRSSGNEPLGACAQVNRVGTVKGAGPSKKVVENIIRIRNGNHWLPHNTIRYAIHGSQYG